MSGIDVTVELPEDETPGELMKGYFTMMRAFGWDLYVTCHFALKPELGAHWFAARISELQQVDPKNWRPNYRFEPQDPGVILRDYVHEGDSPYLKVFGGQFQKQSAAKKILGTRNTWFHFGDDPTTAQLVEAAKVVRNFVASSGMHIGARIDVLLSRLDDLKTGRYPAPLERVAAPEAASAPESVQQDSPAVVPAPEPSERETQVIEAPADLPRPSIGGTWLGPIPELRYRITRTGDVVHPDTMQSVRARVHGDFAAKARAWTAVEPRGRELWIDADGAVGGFIGASPRLLGYLGPDPEGDIARGFFIPHLYTVEKGKIVDLDSGQSLDSVLGADLKEGTTVRVTTYGDVIALDDTGGLERVTTVGPAEWFPGHLSTK